MPDALYARLRRCGDPSCVSGRAFVEHNLFPDLSVAGGGRFQRWQRIASVLREAIRSGEVGPGTELPSVRELAARYELPVAAVRHAVESLAAERLVIELDIVHGDDGGAHGDQQDSCHTSPASRRLRVTASINPAGTFRTRTARNPCCASDGGALPRRDRTGTTLTRDSL